MVAYSFKARFAEAVERGEKTQTIRADRKRHARTGEAIQLYTGMRTKACRKLVDPDPICIVSTYCAVRPDGITLGDFPATDLDEFARADGFSDWPDMVAFFCPDGKEFVGQFVRWDCASSISTKLSALDETGGVKEDCQCFTCRNERDDANGITSPFERATATSMTVCAICGNKRCPHATHHIHACTDSNKPGQPGSRYQ